MSQQLKDAQDNCSDGLDRYAVNFFTETPGKKFREAVNQQVESALIQATIRLLSERRFASAQACFGEIVNVEKAIESLVHQLKIDFQVLDFLVEQCGPKVLLTLAEKAADYGIEEITSTLKSYRDVAEKMFEMNQQIIDAIPK
jgi:hypothetical protein